MASFSCLACFAQQTKKKESALGLGPNWCHFNGDWSHCRISSKDSKVQTT